MTDRQYSPANDEGSQGDDEQAGFSFQLEIEASKILRDPQLVASPTLTRLLKWLVAETIAGRGDLVKSYTIAVDGLGRSQDFDSSTDSYPRVQIGRLKRALESHYAQSGPANGLCLYLEQGSYRLRLGRVSAAYPQLHHPPPSLTQIVELDPHHSAVKLCFPRVAPLSAVVLAAAATLLIFLAVLAAILLAPKIDPLTVESVKHSLPGHQISTLCPQPQPTATDSSTLALHTVQNCG